MKIGSAPPLYEQLLQGNGLSNSTSFKHHTVLKRPSRLPRWISTEAQTLARVSLRRCSPANGTRCNSCGFGFLILLTWCVSRSSQVPPLHEASFSPSLGCNTALSLGITGRCEIELRATVLCSPAPGMGRNPLLRWMKLPSCRLMRGRI